MAGAACTALPRMEECLLVMPIASGSLAVGAEMADENAADERPGGECWGSEFGQSLWGVFWHVHGAAARGNNGFLALTTPDVAC